MVNKVFRTVDIASITFRQLKGGRLICNQTGEIVSQTQAKKYRYMKEREGQTRRQSRPILEPNLVSPGRVPAVELTHRYDTVLCPFCKHKIYFEGAERTNCYDCGKTLRVKFVAYLDKYNDARCPFCFIYHLDALPGPRQCHGCGNTFYIKK